MRLLNLLSLAIAVAATATLSFPCAAKPVSLHADVYHGFTLIDPATKRRISNAYLVIEDGIITKVGRGRPPRSTSLGRSHDLTGRYVLPGFIDAHAHITSSGMQKIEVKNGAVMIKMESEDRFTQHNARIALARGVTTVRNPGGDPEANARYDRMVASATWDGPEAFHAGAVIEPPPFVGSMFVYPRSEAEWQAEAALQAGLGMKYFKLYVDLSEAELAMGIRAAHQHGLKAIAHLDRVSWNRAIDLGIDGLEHALPTSPDLLEPGQRAQFQPRRDSTFMYRWFELADYDGPLMQHLIRRMAARKITTNMTLMVNEIVYNIDTLDSIFAEEIRDALPEVMAVSLRQLRASARGWTAEDFKRARAVMPKVLEFARRLHRAGVPMMIGTDGGGGTFYARELALHVEAGIQVWDVLRMATSETADILEIGNRTGRIRRGYEADLVILDADPVADIRSSSRVYAVVNNGEFLLSTDLRRKP